MVKEELRKVGRGASLEGPFSVLKTVRCHGRILCRRHTSNLGFRKIPLDSF